jgi:hypothetical protein
MDNQTRGIDPISILEGGKDTFKQRSAPYGEAYKRFGHIMMSFFPGGLTLSNADEWNRYACFHMVVAKMARYANCFHEGHIDSSHDSMVYSAMLESLDHEQDLRQPEATKEDRESQLGIKFPPSYTPETEPIPAHMAKPIIPEVLRATGESFCSDVECEAELRHANEMIKRLELRLKTIKNIIWDNGAAIGSDAYFRVRSLAADIDDCDPWIETE